MGTWYNSYLQSDHWRRLRYEKKKSVGFKCEGCGDEHFLQVHHKHYKTLWHESLEDLKVLCGACHKAEHSGPPTWEEIEKLTE